MTEEQPTIDPPQPKAAVKKKTPFQKVLTTCRESLLEQFPGLKPWVTLTEKEAKGVRRGWLLFSLLAVGVALLSARITNEIITSRNKITIAGTNTFYNGKLRELKKALDISAGEKAVLERQRDKAESELAPWKLLANSHETNTPLTQRLDRLYDTVTDSLNGPTFAFYVNDLALDKSNVVKLSKSRDLRITVVNTGNKTAQDIVISASAIISRTNVTGEFWEHQGVIATYANGTIKLLEDEPRWVFKADKPIAQGNFYNAHPLIFSSNLPPSVIPMDIMVYSVGSRKFKTNIVIHLE